MALKIDLNYSPNFNPIKRNPKQIKFLIFHYTGMKNEIEAIKKLTRIQSEVSSHYFIKNNGEIILMVPDSYISWHAGKSSWKSYESLNRYSIGIEINNPGHKFNYKKYSTKQINSILSLSKYLIKKYKIQQKNILGHSDIAPNRKKDPGEKFPWKYLAKNKIGFWHSLSTSLLKKNRRVKVNDEDVKLFYKNLYKIGYSRKFSKNFNKDLHLESITNAFQRRFRQELISGQIDKECLIISNNLLKKHC
ncbi:N-acetylmuramoyl-L-alanine amidase [Pelagibacterales bacterium SAG-MED09]|nr:N-acetylmuramoyl-L-alanine amidase [Pelagibacterales bacterium SAG-MED09]